MPQVRKEEAAVVMGKEYEEEGRPVVVLSRLHEAVPDGALQV